MGRHSKARRDARKRQAPQPRPSVSGSPLGFPHPPPGSARPVHDDFAIADDAVVREVSMLAGHPIKSHELAARVARMTRNERIPASIVADSLSSLVSRLCQGCREDGWSDADLREIGDRRLDTACRARLEHWLRPGVRPGCASDPESLAVELAVGGLLSGLPPLPEVTLPSAAGGVTSVSEDLRRKLATVRALLAKAESTAFDQEAESLTAKAQELISRYALEALLAQADSQADVPATVTMRLWLDAPYVDAKAALVSHVAGANRCRAIQVRSLDLALVVGGPADLASVELLVTSLLVQAERAMRRHGSHVDRSGTSRTRSFRRSFLVSFSVRIGQRLLEASQAAVEEHARDHADDRLLPVLRDQARRVGEAFDDLFPHTVVTTTSVTNGEGWYAGKVAADLAHLDVHAAVADAASDAG